MQTNTDSHFLFKMVRVITPTFTELGLVASFELAAGEADLETIVEEGENATMVWMRKWSGDWSSRGDTWLIIYVFLVPFAHRWLFLIHWVTNTTSES